MRIIVVGASGDIGQVACEALGARHEIITVGRSSGDYQTDVSDITDVEELYRRVNTFDAVVSCMGDATFAPLSEFTQESFMVGMRQKVMGQINLVLAGQNMIADHGSFTLTSGVLDRDPIHMGINAATGNGAITGFVTASAIELSRDVRINAVSPGLLEISQPRYGKYFHGHKPVSSNDVGRAYVKSVEGALTGKTFIVD